MSAIVFIEYIYFTSNTPEYLPNIRIVVNAVGTNFGDTGMGERQNSNEGYDLLFIGLSMKQ